MKNSTITVRPMSAHTGAEIFGVDLRHAMSDQTYHEIRAALNEWGAIFFRDQDITPEQQLGGPCIGRRSRANGSPNRLSRHAVQG